jgi:hypothetical protein
MKITITLTARKWWNEVYFSMQCEEIEIDYVVIWSDEEKREYEDEIWGA